MPTLRNCVMSFKCPNEWDLLSETDDEDVRFCGGCQKEVHFCHDDEDLAKSVRLNRCVAFFRPGEVTERMLLGYVEGPLPREFYIGKLMRFGLKTDVLAGLTDDNLVSIGDWLDEAVDRIALDGQN